MSARENKETLRDHQRQAAERGAGCGWQTPCDLLRDSLIRLDDRASALVESEAREREHEQRAELLRQTKARLADESTEAEAREAVLVEALREAETALDEINVQAHSTASRWIRNRSFDALAKLRSALAGVVEAEPERKDADA